MNVLYACDNSYVWLTAVSMTSLFQNNLDIKVIDVYLLGESITKASEENLRLIAMRFGRSFKLIRTDDYRFGFHYNSGRWPKSSLMRLFSGYLLPDHLENVLYLDSDTVVADNLQMLLDSVPEKGVFTGVLDCVSGLYKKNIGLRTTDPYINAGVLFIKLDRLRSINVQHLIEEYSIKFDKYSSYADQDILNSVFRNEISAFDDPRFNVTTQMFEFGGSELRLLRHPSVFYSDDMLNRAKKNPAVIHYTTCMTTIRPWYLSSDHPKASLFEHYLADTCYINTRRSAANLSNSEDRVLNILNHLPRKLSLAVIGVLHAVIRPLFARCRLIGV